MKTLILGLGNELLSDDGVGLLAARQLAAEVPAGIDVVETSECGIALLEYFLGYERAIILDAIQTLRHPPGAILELRPNELSCVIAPSPHYAGLPEMIALAKELDVPFPAELTIYAMEVADPCTIGGSLSPSVRAALPELVDKVRHFLACGV